jgi:hypothetical protein
VPIEEFLSMRVKVDADYGKGLEVMKRRNSGSGANLLTLKYFLKKIFLVQSALMAYKRGYILQLQPLYP